MEWLKLQFRMSSAHQLPGSSGPGRVHHLDPRMFSPELDQVHSWILCSPMRIWHRADEDICTHQLIDPTSDYISLTQARQHAEEVAWKTCSQQILSKLANTSVRQPLRTFTW